MTYTKRTGLFWDKVDTSGDCWLWTACKGGWGYGSFGEMGKTRSAHTYAYRQVIGPIPEGMFVCHSCDTPACVRPAHLFLGTHQDNMRDMMEKGRHKLNQTKWRIKLNDQQAREIRSRSSESSALLAQEFGVHERTIQRIVSGEAWRNV